MPLKPYLRPSGVYHIRGVHHGVRVDRSAGARSLAVAKQVAESIEREIFDEVILKKPKDRTFAEAAAAYMRGGGERGVMTPLLLELRETPLSRVTQDVIDELATKLYPDGANSTKNRKVYTPISAVLNYAADAWGTPRRRLRRPKQPMGRIDWRTPAEIELWIGWGGPWARLITFYAGTGARASEGVGLDWEDVSPAAQRITFWDDETKGGYARHVDLPQRVIRALPQRAEGRVWRGQRGDPFHAYDAINLGLARRAERRGLPHLHLHVLRHTWATWAYAVTKDLDFVMRQGGWKSPALAMRYIHAGTEDLKEQVLAYGWDFGGVGSQLGSPIFATENTEQKKALNS